MSEMYSATAASAMAGSVVYSPRKSTLMVRPLSSSSFTTGASSARVSPATNRRTTPAVIGTLVTAFFMRGDPAAASMTGRRGFITPPYGGSGNPLAERRSPSRCVARSNAAD